MRVANTKWLRRLVLTFIYTMGVLGIVASGGGGGGGDGASNGDDEPSISVQLIGSVETVLDWTTDRCEDSDYPDLPARAFRDSNGKVQLVSGSTPRLYRMIGGTLDTVSRDCSASILQSAQNYDPSLYDNHEWIGALYTLDGQTIYALVHNEFRGLTSSQWSAERDFSDTQGTDDWRYQQFTTGYADMTYDAVAGVWKGNVSPCEIGRRHAHPADGCDAVRVWVSPVNDTVTISGEVYDTGVGGGDGVDVSILKNNSLLWNLTLNEGDSDPVRFEFQETVFVGDTIRFRVNQRGDFLFDGTHFNPKINIGNDPCPSNNPQLCDMVTITYAESTDAGASFVHMPLPPAHLVANLPLRYEPDAGFFAIWQPSNIVLHPQDGYFYTLLQLDDHPADGSVNLQGMCLVRTATLNDPDSWRAWDGNGFNMRFVDLYTEIVADPEAHRCKSVGDIGALTYGLSYNTFLEKFMLVGTEHHIIPQGFYFSVSDNLIDWSPKQLLMETDLFNTTPIPGRFDSYPTLIDPEDTSTNFEYPGQSPYLYFSRFNTETPRDVDLVRRRIKFTN